MNKHDLVSAVPDSETPNGTPITEDLEDPDYYRKLAAQLREAAASASTAQSKIELIELAVGFETLADCLDKLKAISDRINIH